MGEILYFVSMLVYFCGWALEVICVCIGIKSRCTDMKAVYCCIIGYALVGAGKVGMETFLSYVN